MSTNADLVRRYFEACNGADAGGIAACFCDDAVIYDTNHAPVRGSDEIGAFWADVRSGWSEVRWDIDTMADGGDAVAIEWTMSGLRKGRPISIRGSEHYGFRDGRIAELRQYWTSGPDAVGLVDFSYATDGRFTRPATVDAG